uniref:intraflagellar transport protein 88 homolog isoform X6 n=1 Tax=Halichoerus grypus TaxID=9711 RepID=UPI001658C56A|nr:intraflagellar transport protein 88 homolog isoform X6 [Halichoerus grypus]
MMQNVHLAPETDEDDLYSGYNDYNPTYDTEELENDTAFQQAVRTSHGRRLPITAKIPSTAVTRPIATGYGSKTSLASSMGRPMTGAIQDGITRPMTAVRAAGFTKAALRGSAFDPLGQSRGPAPPLEAKNEDRIKIMQNIGVTFIKTGQYSDAINSFEHIMSMAPNLKAGFNLILSYFAVGDRDKMKKAFQKLIAVPLEIDEDDKYISPSDDPHTNLVIEAIKNDHLRQMERERKAMAEKYIMTAAKLIAPVIETSFAVGYDWCVEVVKASQYVELANDLEINKAITYLRQKDFNQAVETLKMFEKKDSRVKSAAATNLSFLYYLENEFAQASSYADLAVNSDRYNPSALTNKGNTVFANGDYEKAAEFYKEALRNDSSCTEALYNIGNYQKALDTYKDIHRKFPENVECLRFLVRLCTDIGLKEVQEYATKLKRLEKMKEIREQRIKSGRDSSGGSRSRREGSAGSDSGQNCSASSKGERLSAKLRALPGTNEPYESSSNKEIDASYVDPLGPQIERPKTAAKKRIDEDDFADEELGDDLLPE